MVATTESGAPAFPLRTPVPPANGPATGEIETAARELLADELDLDEGDFRFGSPEGMGWSDASPGCPREGMVCAQVITPGYKLIFDHASTSDAVHANSDSSHMIICGDGT